MTDFNDRREVLEKKFAMDAELMFKAEARCCKLFGHWVASKLGLSGDDANQYAGKIVASNLEESGFEDVKRAVRPDLESKGITLSDAELDQELARCMDEAKAQIAADAEAA